MEREEDGDRRFLWEAMREKMAVRKERRKGVRNGIYYDVSPGFVKKWNDYYCTGDPILCYIGRYAALFFNCLDISFNVNLSFSFKRY